MEKGQFEVKTEVFEGPIELLYELVEKKKLHVSDVTIASVADDFIKFVKEHDEFPMEEVSNFVLVAATLLLIKSKALLPSLSLTEEEEERVHDLEVQLELYRQMKAKAKTVSSLFGKKPLLLLQERKKSARVVFSPHKSITQNSVYMAAQTMLEKIPKAQNIAKATVRAVISLQEMISNLAERVEKAMTMPFGDFTRSRGAAVKGNVHKVSREGKVEVIVGFLALLELVKRGMVSAEQKEGGHDILVESLSVETPRMGA